MRTTFSPDQLKDPMVAESEAILRKCVHCGFCTATCPTYVTLGNELDSPRGRIYLIKDMLENNRPADEKTVKHLDRCLSCLACTTTCPSGVDYMHLIDNARAYIEKTYDRPMKDKIIRAILVNVLPYPKRFRLALRFAQIGRPFAGLFKKVSAFKPMGAMLDLAPKSIPSDNASALPGIRAAKGKKRARIAILSGCAQPVLNPAINQATMDLLNRFDVEVVVL
jgi:glycolate oxidase iron-sulfur subunit